MAIQTFDRDLRNPIDFVGEEGTDTWQAPEQLPMMHRTTYEPNPAGWLLGAHTNVWAVGGIVIALMNRASSLRGTKVSDFVKGESQPVISEDVRDRYSDQLRNLVERCTQYWPDDRIGLKELLEEIREYTGTDEGSSGEGEQQEEENTDTAREDTRPLRREEHEADNVEMTLLYQNSDHPYKRRLALSALRALAGEEVESEDGDGSGADGDGDGDDGGKGEGD